MKKDTRKFQAENPTIGVTYWYVDFIKDDVVDSVGMYETEDEADTAISAYMG